MVAHIVDSNMLCLGLGADHAIGPLGLQSNNDAGNGALAPIPLGSKLINSSEVGGREIDDDDSGTSAIDSLKLRMVDSSRVVGGCAKSSMPLVVAMILDGEDMAMRKKNVKKTTSCWEAIQQKWTINLTKKNNNWRDGSSLWDFLWISDVLCDLNKLVEREIELYKHGKFNYHIVVLKLPLSSIWVHN